MKNLTLTIDPRSNRLRISKATLLLLGKPDYIQILINPDKRVIVIMPSVESKNANKIYWDRWRNYELSSAQLVRNILSLSDNPKETRSCRMNGQYIEEKSLVVFDITTAEAV